MSSSNSRAVGAARRERVNPDSGVSQDKQQVRYSTILTALQQSGRVLVDVLSEQLDVSVVTIRRDLDALEQKGLLRRTHGGAVSIEPLFYEPFRRDQISWHKSSALPTRSGASVVPPPHSSLREKQSLSLQALRQRRSFAVCR